MNEVRSKLDYIALSCERVSSVIGVIEQLYMRDGKPVVDTKEEAEGLVFMISEEIGPRVSTVRATAAELLHELSHR